MSNYHEVDRPPVLAPADIEKLLSMRLIANLATIDDDGGIHMVPMWFLRIADDICIPTSRNTYKYHNLRPSASVMIDVSRAGLNLKGVLIRGGVELIAAFCISTYPNGRVPTFREVLSSVII